MTDRTWYKCPECQHDIGVFRDLDYEIKVTQCGKCGKMWEIEDWKLIPYVKPQFIPHHQESAEWWYRKAAECLPEEAERPIVLAASMSDLRPIKESLDDIKGRLVYLSNKITQTENKHQPKQLAVGKGVEL